MKRKPLLGIVVAAVVLLGIEGVLRLTVPRDALLFEWERPHGLIAYAEDGKALVTRPGMQETRYDGPYTWRVRLNDMGLREDGEVPARKEPGTLRILALGDSWMFGFSVDQGKTIPDQLERLLPPKLGGQEVEVLNAGVFGSCAFDMLARYRSFVDAWELDGVLIGQPHNRRRLRQIADQRADWYATVAGTPATSSRLYLLLRRALAPLRMPTYAMPASADADRVAEIGDMRVLAADARTRGLKVWLAELPNDIQDSLERGFRPDAGWREGLGPEGVTWGGHALGERACWGFVDRGHPSEAGARAIAEAVADTIAGGASLDVPRATPRCADLPEAGPGKPGWEWSD